MRLAIGAGRWRLIRQMLIETAMLFLLSMAPSLVLARLMTDGIVGAAADAAVPDRRVAGAGWPRDRIRARSAR